MNTNFELPPDLFADDTEIRIPNDENENINFDLIMEPITPERPEKKVNTLEGALTEADKYIQSLENDGEENLDSEFEQEVLNGPNIHDCYKPLKLKIPIEIETEVKPDSPRPVFSKRPNNLICKVHDLA